MQRGARHEPGHVAGEEHDGSSGVLDRTHATRRGRVVGRVEHRARGLDEPRIAKALHELHALFTAPPDQLEGIARLLVQRLVLIAQACLLKRHAPAYMADAFIATRLASPTGINGVFGAMDVRGLEVDAILERALPQ